jgi:hypothetical protein
VRDDLPPPPEAFSAIYVTNGWPHREEAHFRSFTLSLTAAQAGVMTLEPRFVGLEFLADHCDAVVTHHWENGLNYLYYEALYGNYPLVHNSAFLQDLGYYYPDFDAEAGAAALLTALADHPAGQAEHAERASALFARLDPTSAANIALHEGLLARADRDGAGEG